MILCSGRIYEYHGMLFEIPKIGGPWPLKKDGTPKMAAGNKFYDLIAAFYTLSKDEQERCRISGGCAIIEEEKK